MSNRSKNQCSMLSNLSKRVIWCVMLWKSISLNADGSNLDVLSTTSILVRFPQIRGGAREVPRCFDATLTTKKSSKKISKKATQNSESLSTATDNGKMPNQSVKDNAYRDPSRPKIHVKAILMPRQTSILKPLQFLSFLMINVSLNYCFQTAGKPLEDAVRKLLDMPPPVTETGFMGSLSSKVTPLHVYVAKKIISSADSSSVGVLPPAHLPAPLPLLGLFLSLLFYVGGTILVPKWSVVVKVFLDYMQFSVQGNDDVTIRGLSDDLEYWFSNNDADDNDLYYESSLKSKLGPAVLVHEHDFDEGNDIRNLARYRRQGPAICTLHRSPALGDDTAFKGLNPIHTKTLEHPHKFYFEFNRRRYYYDPANENNEGTALIDGGPTLHETVPIAILHSKAFTRGLCSRAELAHAKQRYAEYNHISIPIPSITSAFIQRITSPLVSLQLLGRLLSLVEEESLGRSFANLFRLGSQHWFDAKRSISNAITLAEEVRANEDLSDIEKGSRFWAVRPVKAVELTPSRVSKSLKSRKRKTINENVQWVQLSGNELLPGDVFFVETKKKVRNRQITIPVDALLLEGSCVTEEAALTGESVPQAKVPIELSADEVTTNKFHHATLDMTGNHRSSCIFAGTKMLFSSNELDSAMLMDSSLRATLPPLPCFISSKVSVPPIFLALRTGSYSSRGEILQSLLKTRLNLGAISNRGVEWDSIRLIAVLAVFAFGACAYLLIDSTSNARDDSIFKRIVQCTRIAVASVPSDLPASLSASARECASILRDESDAICSVSGSLVESSMVNMVVFDKTGTLTADTQQLISTVHPPSSEKEFFDGVPFETVSKVIFAGGHSLVSMSSKKGSKSDFVGDPLDASALSYSGWNYSPQDKSATPPEKPVKKEYPAKIWQIKSFPFNSDKKMSSAVVLIKKQDGKYRLWAVVKGSSDVMRRQFFQNDDPDQQLRHWYEDKIKTLGKSGYRSIALGTVDITYSKIAKMLFPAGLPDDHDTQDNALQGYIKIARGYAVRLIHRDDIEQTSSLCLNGFACFEAPMRAGTRRVIQELKNANFNVCVLTGDEITTSLALAAKAGVTFGNNPYFLKVSPSGSMLEWEINGMKMPFTLDAALKIHQAIERNDGVVVFSGDAVSLLLSDDKNDEISQYVRSVILPEAQVVAGSSPHQKYLFLRWLQNECRRRVLMCGDGVNDIAAMRESFVSVAMLSGFVNEFSYDGGDSIDTGELRRKERLKKWCIGSNRMLSTNLAPSSIEGAGIGNSAVASIARIRVKVINGLNDIDRTTKSNPNLGVLMSIIRSAIGEEISRYKELKKGGSGAANILAEEERLKESIISATHISPNVPRSDTNDITTGEACLASSFTLLRPCISGVESILRAGIAAAAYGISLHRKVALNCMLSCYNLATLYKDGLRYGKYMWQVELAGIVFNDRGSSMASSTPRPRLVTDVRPSTSPFDLAESCSTLLQAVSHIVTLTLSVNSARRLEAKYPTHKNHGGINIKWKDKYDSNDACAGALLSSLVKAPFSTSLISDSEDDDTERSILFRKRPFEPNFFSNHVFIVSLFQNAVMTLVNHRGWPFSISFLENRTLCLSVGLSFLLSTLCVAETFPVVNRALELKPLPNQSSKIELLRLLLFNLVSSYFAEYISEIIFNRDVWRKRICLNAYHPQNNTCIGLGAAEEADRLLTEERRQNGIIMYFIALIIFNACFRTLNK